MKIGEMLRGAKRLFLDTAPVIYFVERNPDYLERAQPAFAQIDAGTITAVTSPVTLSECLVVPLRLGLESLRQDFVDLLQSGANTTFVNIDGDTARRAAELRARYNLSLPDAFQVAAALAASCDAFLTNDATLKRVTELTVIVLDDLDL